MRIEHELRNAKNFGMLIPYGDYKNMNIVEAEIGQVCETIDTPPKKIEIIAKAVITADTAVANCLSELFYDIPFKTAFGIMKKTWKHDINYDKVLLVVARKPQIKRKLVKYNIAHAFTEELLVPWVAISDNLDFIVERPKKITTSDFIEANIVGRKEIHIISEEGIRIVKRLYDIPLELYLKRWYSKYPDMVSMSFIYLKLEKTNGAEIKSETVSAENN